MTPTTSTPMSTPTSTPTSTPRIRVCVDRGGTFTDCIAFVPNAIRPPGHAHAHADAASTGGFRQVVVKLLSVDPANYPDAPREGIRRILELATGRPHPRGEPLDTSNLELIRMGTTVATNALLERKGERTALLITAGFKDLLHIGNQSRPNIFDLSINAPDVLYERVIEVDERVTLVGFSAVSSGMAVDVPKDDPSYVKGVTGEWVHILKRPDTAMLEEPLKALIRDGIKSIAICLIHSFTFPDHERQLGDLCKSLGFENVTLSSATMPMIKMVPRGTSTTADAYLTPCIKKYLEGFFAGFDDGIRQSSAESSEGHRGVRVEFMQSDGGLVHVDGFNGFRAILSGPAGGVVGYAMTSWDAKERNAVIGFDMGGTSTDVSRYAGRYEHVYETTTAGVTIQAPQLDINTVAAGGGSRLFFRNGMFVVGPESAGADPGPACYRKSGPLTITDANLLLDRLIPSFFPKIFGKSEKEPLDAVATQKAFDALAKSINAFLKDKHAKETGASNSSSNSKSPAAKKGKAAKTEPSDAPAFVPMTRDEIAYGFIKVANESMCRPIRALTEGKGYNAADHILASFGGAGGQHAFAIARSLGIKTVLIHRHSSILSAYGIALADVVHEVQEPSAFELVAGQLDRIKERVAALSSQATQVLSKQGFKHSQIENQVYLNLRYQGTDNAMMTLKPSDSADNWDFASAFVAQYQQEFGFTLPDRATHVDDIRVRGIGKSAAMGSDASHTKVHEEIKRLTRRAVSVGEASTTEHAFWEGVGRVETPVFELTALKVGDEIIGPALIIDATATIAVEPHCTAVVTSEHVVGFVGRVPSSDAVAAMDESKDGAAEKAKTVVVPKTADPILLSVFGHRFMSIAEQMGRTLQKTSISTNIKERLDFSCALFGPDGGLVANAPHIPVHLGSMQEAVRWQMSHLQGKLKDGDVIVTNHPAAGGSHLPDITVITPVFDHGNVVFFVASRGHHADIGGIQPGSMPPNSRELHFLVRNGHFDEAGITKILLEDPAKFDGCSGTRCLRDNISDLKAQVAANHKGIVLVKSLIDEYGLEMNAELAVRNLLKTVAKERGTVLHASDRMDDGSTINLAVTISTQTGSAIFDFSGTGPEVYANTNAPRAVTYSAIIYCLRALINLDMPLNQGALAPIDVRIPVGSFLNPSETAAVVGGNVLTSQRLCDVVLKAFHACAASQGCCNNFTFGMGGRREDGSVAEGFGYYETIAGGSGAGPTWHGRSGVHTHMTNTRITDPEIMERRYPVILRRFGLRAGSGGHGQFNGGDGVVREVEFLETLHVSMLSERRVFAPYGLDGGEDGKSGSNILMRLVANDSVASTATPSTTTATTTASEDGRLYRVLNFGGKNATVVKPGDRLRIETPGGGGWGKADTKRKRAAPAASQAKTDDAASGDSPSRPRRNPPRRSGGGSLQAFTDMQHSA
ncbi:Hydantoinase B/oxoprolinase-domain-containing protein [Entophlyctis helioformis]|nr:Hydantoinase B/oxoprolinase-domain-containing protein [Entophlyctis helioformis]